MKEWFLSDPVMAVLYIVAVPATVILVLQTILLLFGVGHGDNDIDAHDGDFGEVSADRGADDFGDHDDGGLDGDAGLRLFTVRGLVAFFAVGGWSGIAALELGADPFVSIVAAILMGFGALILVALFFKWALSLQYNGTLNMNNAVGRTGEVYLTVPAKNGGRGKVNIVIQESFTEIDAITYCERALRYGERVRVTAMADDNTVVVEPQ